MPAPILTYPRFKAWVPATGLPAATYWVKTYQAGTNFPMAAFADSALATPIANPFQLDAQGERVVYAQPGVAYKIQLLLPDMVTQVWAVDGVIFASAASGGGGAAEWIATGFTPTFISATSFSVQGDQTPTLTVGRRLQTTNTGGTIYSTITSSAFSTGTTTVTVVNDSGVLDSGLTVINVGIINASAIGGVFTSVPGQSFVSAAPTHSSEVLANGVALVISTANGFGLATLKDYLGNFNATTGTFTAGRAGLYWIMADVEISTTGVTFSSASSVDANVTGVTFAGPRSGQFVQEIPSGAALARAKFSQVIWINAGGTITFSITANFSAGTPVYHGGGGFTIVGPL